MALASGDRLGPYEIVSPIGAGGMGEVYKAKDTRLDRTVAIKVMPARVAGDPEMKQRFEREARTIAGLSHPNICTLHDIGTSELPDQAGARLEFLVMEYLEGETLAERLAGSRGRARGTMPPGSSAASGPIRDSPHDRERGNAFSSRFSPRPTCFLPALMPNGSARLTRSSSSADRAGERSPPPSLERRKLLLCESF